MEAESNKFTIAQAARWYARLRAPDCTDIERQAFEQWLKLDRAHALAYAQAERMADRITQQVFADSRLRALAAAALQSRENGFRISTSWRWAAAFVLSVALGALSLSQYRGQIEAMASTKTYTNGLSQQQRIELKDGSVIHLDVGAKLSVQMSKAERRIELLTGRAFFEVAHDSSRPFSVSSGGSRTIALGTRFQVSLSEKAVSVTLEQGSVAVVDTSKQTRWRETLAPGEQLNVNLVNSGREKLHVDADSVTSWSQGRLVFKGTPLGEALAELNRYAAVKVHLGDQTLAAVPIGGNFVAGGNSEDFVDALAAVLPLKGVRVGADEIVLFQRYETETHT